MSVEDGVMEQLDAETSEQLTQELDPMASKVPQDVPGEAPEMPKPEPQQEEPPKLDDATINAATEMGLDVDALGAEAVKGIVEHAERSAFNRFRSMFGEDQQQQQEEQQPPLQRNEMGQWMPRQDQQQQQQQPPAQQPQEEEPLPEFKIELDPDAYDEDIIKTLNGMAEHFTKVTEGYKTRLDNVTQMLQSQAQEADERRFLDAAGWFDEAVQSTGEESVFGRGSIDKLPQNSELIKHRVELNEVYQHVLMWKGIQDPYTKDDELLRLAVRWYESDKASHSQQQNKQLSNEVSKRSKQTIGRPSKRSNATSQSEHDSVDPESGYPQHVIRDMERRISEYREQG